MGRVREGSLAHIKNKQAEAQLQQPDKKMFVPTIVARRRNTAESLCLANVEGAAFIDIWMVQDVYAMRTRRRKLVSFYFFL
jgi:hypothetical protein